MDSTESIRQVTISPASEQRKLLTLRVAVRIVILMSGVALFIWALNADTFRDIEGFPTARICLPLAITVCIIVLSFAVEARWRAFCGWLSLLLMANSAALQFIEAGNVIRYQHFRPLSHSIDKTTVALWTLLFVQFLLVSLALWRRRSNIVTWLKKYFRFWRFLVIGILFIGSSAAVSRSVPAYIIELFVATIVGVISLGNLFLLATSFPEDRLSSVKRFLRPNGMNQLGGGFRWSVLFASLWVTGLAAFLNYYSYEQHPHLQDEVAYLHQARYFAAGRLTLPASPVPEAFHLYLIEVDGQQSYAVPPFGWPAFLALGVLLGAPWLVNPILAGLNTILAYFLARQLFDLSTARWVLILLCVSPWHIFLAMSFMTHTLVFTCGLIATLAVARARQNGKAQAALVAGATVGFASLIRPLEGAILAVLLGLWLLGVRGNRQKSAAIASFAITIIAVGVIGLIYNMRLAGNPLTNPIMAYTDKHFGINSNAFGFGADRGMGWELDPYPGHGIADAAVNTSLNLFSLNIELFGWSVGSLLLVAGLLLFRLRQRSETLMLVVIAVVVGAHAFYWFSGGPDFGARYWFLVLFPCLALTARGIRFLEVAVRSWCRGPHHIRVSLAVLSLCAVSLVNYFPWRAVDKYHHYLRMRPDIRQLARQFNFGKSLVLIRGNEHPDYASTFAYNPLDLNSDVPIYAWDRDPGTTKKLLTVYQDRPVWIVNGPSITKRGFEVVNRVASAGLWLQETDEFDKPSE